MLSVVLLVSGCANVVMPPQDTGKTTSEKYHEIAESLPSTDAFSGTDLTVLAPESEIILGDEEAAGSVRNALRNRNSLIASIYEMEVCVDTVSEDEILETLRAAEQAGIAAGDLLCYSAETTAALWAAGLLTDLNTLPYFDIQTGCYDAAFATSLQTGNSVYLLPDPSAQSYDRAYVLFYDRALVTAAGLPFPEEAVKNGTWTFAMFQQYAEAVAASVMERSSYDLQTDIFGYSSTDNTDLLPYLLWCAQGLPLFAQQETGSVGYVYDAEQLSELTESLVGLYGSACLYPLDGTDAYQAFEEGRLGFLFAELEYIKELYANAERDYGILPLPKRDEAQEEYICPIGVSGGVFSAPALMSDAARSGLGLTAICAAGGALLQEAEKQTYITLYARDNNQTCMLEMTMDSIAFDFGWVYGTQSNAIKQLSDGMMTDVIVNGSRFTSILREYLDAFQSYADENFS